MRDNIYIPIYMHIYAVTMNAAATLEHLLFSQSRQ